MAFDLDNITFDDVPDSEPRNNKSSQIKSNFSEAVKSNADVHAKDLDLSRKTGVPVESIAGDRPAVQQKFDLGRIDFSDLPDKSPNTAKFLSNYDNAVVAQDDVKSLEGIEADITNINYFTGGRFDKSQFPPEIDLSRALSNVGGSALLGFESQGLGIVLAGTESQTVDGIDSLVPSDALPPGMEVEAVNISREVAANLGITNNSQLQQARNEAIDGILTDIRSVQTERGKLTPDDLNTMEQGVRAGIESLINMAPGMSAMILTGGASAIPLLSTIGVQTFGDSYGNARADGLDIQDAQWKASIDAAIEVGTELLPTKVLSELLTGGADGNLTKKAMKFLLRDIGSEQLATLGQSINDYAFGLDEQMENATTVEEMVNIQLQRQAVTAIASVVTSGSIATATTSVKKAIQTAENVLSKTEPQVQSEQEKIDGIADKVNESKLKARDKETFKQFVLDADGDNNTTVFIDGVQAKLYLNSLPRDQIASDPALALIDRQVAEASEIGGDVAISIADFTTDIVGTPHFEALRESMSLDSESPSPFRLEQVKQEQTSYVESLLATANENASQYVEAQNIFTEVRDQLVDTGRLSPEAASTVAEIVPAWATATAARSGKTVAQVYADAGLTIEGPQTGERARLDAEAGVLRQGVVDQELADDLLSEISDFSEVDDNGLVSVFHRTSKENADSIRASGQLTPKENGLFFSTSRVGQAEGFGDEVIEFKIPADQLQLDDIFDEEAHLRLPATANVANDVSQYLPQAPAETVDQLSESIKNIEGVKTLNLFETRKGDLKLDTIIVDQESRKSGVGTNALTQIIDFADQNGRTVQLTPAVADDFQGTTSRARLVKFYKRFGFVENKGRNKDFEISESMYRLPQSPTTLQQEPQTPSEAARGFYSPSEVLIRLNETSDLSTFLHEFAHFAYDMEIRANGTLMPSINGWFKRNSEEVVKEAQQTNQSVTEEDLNLYLDEGTTGDTAKDSAFMVATHEQFARGFETYLMEGKAPSIELRNAFRTFARWLTQVYKRIKGDLKVTLDDDARAFFDRLVATEDQIAAAEARAQYEPLFTDAAMAGMTEEEFAKYQERVDKVKDVQAETLRDKLIKQLTRATTKWWKEELSDLVDAETVKLRRERVYKARAQLTTTDIKLDRVIIKEIYGVEKTDTIGRTRRLPPTELRNMTAPSSDALSPDQVAAVLDYNSGDEMVRDLIDAPKLKDLALSNAQAQMVAKYGDILNDGTIEQQADEAVQNEQRGELLLRELKALAAGTRQQSINRQVIKDIATERIGRLSFKEIHPGKYRKAEIRAAQESARALQAGNREGAATAKAQQVINYYLGMEATAARAEVIKITGRMSRYGKKSVVQEIQKAGNEYWEQISKILERFEFRKGATLKGVEQRNTDINTWVAERINNDGDALVLSPAVLNESLITHWKNVPFKDLQGINDSVKNIEHVARYSNRLTRDQEQIDFKTLVNRWVTKISEQPVRFTAQRTDVIRGRKWGRWAMAQMTKIPYMASWMDGNERAGLSHQILVQPFTDAYDAELRLFKEVGSVVLDAIDNRSSADLKRHNTKLYIPEIAVDGNDGNLFGHQVLAVALNTGNAGNLKKMLLGEGWANAERPEEINMENRKLQAVLNHMTKADWEMVQLIWDQMEVLYPKLAAVHRETTGLTPPKVESTPVTTEFGTFNGGYYPIKYDPSRSQDARENEDRLAAETESMFSNSASIQASVNTGATNERTGYYAPMRLSLDVVGNHFQETIHYITHHKVVRETNKLLRDKSVAEAITKTLGPEEFAQLRPWLNDIAKDGREAPIKTWWGSILQRLRFGTTLGVMGFKASTGIIQISGLSNTVAEVGLSNVIQASRTVLGSVTTMRSAWDFASSNSKVLDHRAQTFDREVKNALEKIGGKRGILAGAQELSMKHIALIQTYMVDLPSWHAAYIKGMNEHGDEQRAYQYADWVVENVQGSGATKDLPQILRNQSQEARMFTMFMTFFSSLWNLERDIVKGVRNGAYSATSLGAKIAFLFTVPVLFEMLLRGDFGDDEEDKLQSFLTKQALFPVQSIPFIRDIASGATGEFGYNISPIAQLLDTGVRSIPELVKRGFTDEEITKGQVKGAVKFAGAAVGIPGTSQAWATGEHLYNVLVEGEDLTFRGVTFGDKPKK